VNDSDNSLATNCPIKRLFRWVLFRWATLTRRIKSSPRTASSGTLSLSAGSAPVDIGQKTPGAVASSEQVNVTSLEQAFATLLKAVAKHLDTDELRRILKRFQPIAYDKFFEIERIDEKYGRPSLPILHLPASADISARAETLLTQVSEAIREFTLAAQRFDHSGLSDQAIRQLLDGILITLEEIRDRLQSYLNGPEKGQTDGN